MPVAALPSAAGTGLGLSSVGTMLIAEDLLLLVTDDASGRLLAPAAQIDAGLGGANLVELTLLKKVDLSGAADVGKPGRIIVRDRSPAGDAVLDAALAILVAHQGGKPSTVIRPLSKNLRQVLYERLAASGVLRAERGRSLGIFPTHLWPTQDARHEAEMRQQVTQALINQVAPDVRTAALIALLHALRCEHKIVDPGSIGLSKQELRTRAEEFAKGNWGSEAVRKAIVEMIAAVVAVTSTAAAASTG